MSTLLLKNKLSKAFAGAALVGLSVVAIPKTAQAFSFTSHTEQAEWVNDLKGQPFKTETFNQTLQPGIRVTSTVGAIKAGVWEDQVNNQPLQTTQWHFAKPIFAWGANMNLGPSDPGAGIAVSVSKLVRGQQYIGEVPNTYAGEFWGFVADEVFNAVTFKAGTQEGYRETYTMDNMVYAEPVPEPTTLLGSFAFAGFLATVWFKRQQLQKASNGICN